MNQLDSNESISQLDSNESVSIEDIRLYKKIAITINFKVFLLWKQLANEVLIF